MTSIESYYNLLGVPQDASKEEIKRAYHEAALQHHPDVNVEPGATELFLQVNEAFQVLIDPQKRDAYDKQLQIGQNLPVTVHSLYSRNLIPILDEPQLFYALIDIRPDERFIPKSRPQLNISLILDRSTSMQGERMDKVKLAAIEFIRQLEPDDILSIITFSDRAEVILPASHNLNLDIVETQIRMIRSGGGTEIFQGLEAGYSELLQSASRSSINQIILFTDGRTYGDVQACIELADQAARRGVQIIGLGIGNDWNDLFIDELVGLTGGSSHYISENNDISSTLQKKVESLKRIFADKLALKLDLGENISLNSVLRLGTDPAIISSSNPIRLGRIQKHASVPVLLEFIVTPLAHNSNRRTLAEGNIHLVLSSDLTKSNEIPIQLNRPTVTKIVTDPPHRRIYNAISKLTLYRMQERARHEAGEGKFHDAGIRLQNLGSQLFSIGEKELATIAFDEAERLLNSKSLSAEGEKRIKYGTRSLLLPASSMDT